jgi:enoyl-CoA hydratase/carnithine racemase
VPDPVDLVEVERREHVAVVSISRSDVRNALNDDLREQLIDAFESLSAVGDVRCVVLRGNGADFCAGADITELADRTPQAAAWPRRRIDLAMERAAWPVVAALRGNVLGGGLEIALACTVRIAGESFRGGLPEVGLGVIPGLGGTQRLPRIVGEAVALDMILTGRLIDAAEALSLGLVSRVVPDEALDEEALSVAVRLAGRAPLAVRAAIEAVRASSDLARERGIEAERALYALLCATEDKAEGVRAWQEKRRPEFKGR